MRNTIYFDSFFLNQVIARKVDLSRKRELARVKLARKFKPHFFFFFFFFYSLILYFFLLNCLFSSLNRDSLRTPSLALSKKANFLLFSSRSNFSNHLFIPDLFSCLLITASRFLVTTVSVFRFSATPAGICSAAPPGKRKSRNERLMQDFPPCFFFVRPVTDFFKVKRLFSTHPRTAHTHTFATPKKSS